MKQSKIERAFLYLVKESKPVSAAELSAHLSKRLGGVRVGSTAIGSMMADLRKLGCDVKRIYKGMSPNTRAQVNQYHLLTFPNGLFGVEIKVERCEVRA